LAQRTFHHKIPMFAAIRMFILNSMMPTSGVTKPEETTRFLQKPGNQSGPVNPIRFHRTTGFSRGKNKPMYCSKTLPSRFSWFTDRFW
jgi:hypothetical protein